MTQKYLALKLLNDEHQKILSVISFLEHEVQEIKNGKVIDEWLWNEIIFFIKNFADKIHHAKEEDILFKEFCREEVLARTHCNPIQQMLYEHELGRDFVKKMEDSLTKNDNQQLAVSASSYAQLLTEHIYKEENILYPMIADALKPEEMLKVEREFIKVNKKSQSQQSCGVFN